MWEIITSILMLFSGVGVFIAGMNMMSDGLEKSAGAGMKKLLSKITNNRVVGVGIGAAVTAIIQKNKILEINGKNFNSGKYVSATLPDFDMIERYFTLGGRNISYASDAHAPNQIIEGRKEIVARLKAIGFTHFTVPCRGEYIKIPL